MGLHLLPGHLRIPQADLPGDLLVVLDRRLLALYGDQGHTAHPVKMDGDVLDEAVYLGFAGDPEQILMEFVVQPHEIFWVVVVQIEVLKAHILLQGLKVCRSDKLTDLLHDGALQHIPHESGLVYQIVIDEGDDALPLGVGFNDLHLGQLDQRLPHRRFADLILFHQFA